MSYYDDASLVVIPSGYKTSKVYAEKPTDGSGDLTFTRTGDTATRVNSAGLIEKVRTNLCLQSNTFNTTWTTTSASVTSGQAGYDGSSNAWLLSKSGAYGRVEQTLATTGLETFSVYVKAGTSNYTEITSNAGPYVGVNLTNGSIVAQSGVTALVVSVGSGWYRISIAYTKAASNIWRVIAGDAGSTSSAAGATGTIVIQNAQAETGDIATDYIATTTAAVSVGPVSNVPRLDYLGSSCPRLLLEPQRTNSVTYSEQFDNSAWSKNNSTVTANQAVSPDGYTNADLFYINSAGNVSARRIIQSATVSSGTTYTSSVFVKSNSARWLWFPAPDASSANHEAWFDLQNGVVGTVGSSVTGTSIVSYGNGWYRCSVTSVATSTTNYVIFAPVIANGSTTTVSGSSNALLIYGAGLEAGAYATSYIPTLSASVTRVADVTTKAGISSLIGSTEGVLFVEADMTLNSATNRVFIDVNDNNLTNRALINISNNVIGGFVQGVTRVSYTIPSSGRYKIAFGYKSGDFVLYVNGVQRSTSSASVTFSGMNQLFLGHTFADGTTQPSDRIAQALLFKTRLTNAQLAELTTL